MRFNFYDVDLPDETRGNVTARSRLLTTHQPPDATVGFSGHSYSHHYIVTDSGTATSTMVLSLTNIPLRPGYTSVMVEDLILPNLDDGWGNILGKGICGSINYATGLISLTFSDPVMPGKGVTVTYSQDFEVSADPKAPTVSGKQIEVKFDESVTATLRIKQDRFDRMNSSIDGIEVETLKLLKKRLKKELSKL